MSDTQVSEPVQVKEPVAVKERKRRNLSDETRKRLSEAAKTGGWAQHLAAFRAAHPDIKGKHVYSEASKTYQKKAKESKESKPEATESA